MRSFDLRASYGGFELQAAARWESPCAALFGASGAGKSTVLEAIAGLRPGVRGSVELDGTRVDRLPAHRRCIGWVPQDSALFPHKSVRENLLFGDHGRGATGEASVRERRFDEVVETLELEPLLERSAADLSGGERQRVAIGRALLPAPRLLLLDEPLASLDRPLRARLVPYLRDIPERMGIPVFLVSHDPLEVSALAQEVFVIEAGRIVTSGAPASVFASAASWGGLRTLGAENRFEVRVLERAGGTLRIETAGGLALSMVRVEGFPEPERVAVRAEDVLIAERDPGVVSARNVFGADVVRIEPLGEQLLVHLEAAGEPWCVKITPQAAKALGVEPGKRLVLLVKAHQILPVR
ncbi:MAG TPA: ATP-binding cassette domain-containing protein [Planctomycetes bacterium]|nr:ATP-binding cassette domain-containing protein [Planctomycetota bacterium]